MTHIHFGCINKGGLMPVREALALGYDVSMVVTDELEKNLEDGKDPVADLIHTRKVSNYSDVDELTDAVRGTSAAVVVATHDRQLLRDLGDWPRLAVGAA